MVETQIESQRQKHNTETVSKIPGAGVGHGSHSYRGIDSGRSSGRLEAELPLTVLLAASDTSAGVLQRLRRQPGQMSEDVSLTRGQVCTGPESQWKTQRQGLQRDDSRAASRGRTSQGNQLPAWLVPGVSCGDITGRGEVKLGACTEELEPREALGTEIVFRKRSGKNMNGRKVE